MSARIPLLLKRFISRVRSLFHEDTVENELAAELQFHLQKEIEKNVAAGMSQQEARYAALRSLAVWSKSKRSAATCEESDSSKNSGRMYAMAFGCLQKAADLRLWLSSL